MHPDMPLHLLQVIYSGIHNRKSGNGFQAHKCRAADLVVLALESHEKEQKSLK